MNYVQKQFFFKKPLDKKGQACYNKQADPMRESEEFTNGFKKSKLF